MRSDGLCEGKKRACNSQKRWYYRLWSPSLEGLEPSASGLGGSRSIQLSYRDWCIFKAIMPQKSVLYFVLQPNSSELPQTPHLPLFDRRRGCLRLSKYTAFCDVWQALLDKRRGFHHYACFMPFLLFFLLPARRCANILL